MNQNRKQLYLDSFRECKGDVTSRLNKIFILFFVCLALIVVRLWQLQILNYNAYAERSVKNRIKKIRTTAARGNILDRYGRLLVTNKPSFVLTFTREEVDREREYRKIIRKTSELLGINYEELWEPVEEALRKRRHFKFIPITLKRNLSDLEVSIIEAYKFELPGINIEVFPRRHYRCGDLGAHLMGYMGEVNEAELERFSDLDYKEGDYIGKSGLERVLNTHLTGVNGYKLVESTAAGRVVRVLPGSNVIEPVPGKNCWLTMDLELQRKAEELLGDAKGVIIAMKPKTGEILAMASNPAYDPNLFAVGISYEQWDALQNNKRLPLFNRAIKSAYSPGSIFKIIMAVAGLESGVIDPATSFQCNGFIRTRGGAIFRCWKKGGHGKIGLQRAIIQSCNVYFYNIGKRLGIEKIEEYGKLFGLGQSSHFILPGEDTGLMPGIMWKKKAKNEKWYFGDTMNVSIGQGYLRVNPLQALNIVNLIANEGKVFEPRLILKVEKYDSSETEYIEPRILRNPVISRSTFDAVKKALHGVVNKGGTGRRACIPGLDIAGKTGTSQVANLSDLGLDDKDEEDIPVKLRDHAWFASFAPVDDPQLSCIVFLENGGKQGAIKKLEISRDIYRYYFREKLAELQTQGV